MLIEPANINLSLLLPNKGPNLRYMIPSSLHEKPSITPKTRVSNQKQNFCPEYPSFSERNVIFCIVVTIVCHYFLSSNYITSMSCICFIHSFSSFVLSLKSFLIITVEPVQFRVFWHPVTKNYGPKVFWLTKIKPGYSDILTVQSDTFPLSLNVSD